jgi:hypothetical protein
VRSKYAPVQFLNIWNESSNRYKKLLIFKTLLPPRKHTSSLQMYFNYLFGTKLLYLILRTKLTS